MEVFPKNVKLQIKCCSVIREYSLSPFGALYFTEANAGKLIEIAMFTHMHNLKLQSQSCAAIWAICTHSSLSTSLSSRNRVHQGGKINAENCREKIWDLGLCEHIISCVSFPNFKKYPLLIKNALGALWSFDHSYSIAILGLDRTLLKFIKLRKLDAMTTTIALSLISRYSSVKNIALRLTSYKCYKHVSDTLKEERFGKNYAVLDAGLLVLGNLAFWDFCKAKVHDENAIDLAIKFLTENPTNRGICIGSTKVLANLGTIEAYAREIFSKKAINLVIAAAKNFEGNGEVAMCTTSFFRNLAFYDEERILPLVGSIELIESYAKMFPDNTFLLKQGKEAKSRMNKNREHF